MGCYCGPLNDSLLPMSIVSKLYKMRIRLIISLLVLNSSLHAQVTQQAETNYPVAVNTYAVIVGISEYQNEIAPLDFAHKDAKVFADYLRSKAGGSVPEENVRLLLNKDATHTAIYNALDWLLNTCQP